MVRFLFAVALVLSFKSIHAGELEDIKACSEAAKVTANVSLEITSAMWTPNIFSPNTVKWSNAYCEVKNDATVFHLTVDGKRHIIEGFYGVPAKNLMLEIDRIGDHTIEELRKRIKIIETARNSSMLLLKSPNPKLEQIKSQFEAKVEKVLNDGGVEFVKERMVADKAKQEEAQRLERERTAARAEADKLRKERIAVEKAKQEEAQRLERERTAARAEADKLREQRESEKSKESAWMNRGKQAVKEKLRDPSSAKFRNVYFHRGSDNVPMTCGEVSSKNSFGGYGDYQKFMSAGESDLTFLEEQFKDYNEFVKLWNKFCATPRQQTGDSKVQKDDGILIPRSVSGDKGKYFLIEKTRSGDIVRVLHKREGVDSVVYTITETNCATMKMREIGYSEQSPSKIKEDPTKWFELLPGSSKSDLANFVCK
ncbi:hypothetical protein D5125_17040 [Magnetovirga frankeli]|nr:hypothetical protein D5125_17040 [gamma proteobacterium SS-5]